MQLIRSKRLLFLVGTLFVVAILGGAVALQSIDHSSPSLFNTSKFLNETYFGYLLNNPTAPSPVGIAAYGLSNYSGSVRSYSIDSSEVVGEANVTALSPLTTWNNSVSPSGSFLSCVQCASLQMNVNAIVRTQEGEQVFWIQNLLSFSNTTKNIALRPIGMIWNQTTINADITPQTSGNGSPNILGQHNNIVYGFGSFVGGTANYSLPLSIRLTTSIASNPNGISIVLSDYPFGDGTFSTGNDSYGIASIPISNVISASIVVTPNTLYPWNNSGIFPTLDSELVWTGYCCGQTTKFTAMSSNLFLSYLNSEGHLVSYPSFYTFGDVIETASNLQVIPTVAGGQVVVGENNNSFVGN
jgi:Thermopsin